MPLLEARNLAKSYSGRRVVDGVSFEVNAGEVVGLLGRNGAGKTTSFRMAIGMITPEGGSVHFDGNDVTHEPMYRHALAGMGYLSQEPSVFQRLSCEENLLAILETQALARPQARDVAAGHENWSCLERVGYDNVGAGLDERLGVGRAAGEYRADQR